MKEKEGERGERERERERKNIREKMPHILIFTLNRKYKDLLYFPPKKM